MSFGCSMFNVIEDQSNFQLLFPYFEMIRNGNIELALFIFSFFIFHFTNRIEWKIEQMKRTSVSKTAWQIERHNKKQRIKYMQNRKWISFHLASDKRRRFFSSIQHYYSKIFSKWQICMWKEVEGDESGSRIDFYHSHFIRNKNVYFSNWNLESVTLHLNYDNWIEFFICLMFSKVKNDIKYESIKLPFDDARCQWPEVESIFDFLMSFSLKWEKCKFFNWFKEMEIYIILLPRQLNNFNANLNANCVLNTLLFG